MATTDRALGEAAYGEWESRARDVIVSAMIKRGLSYKGLALRLERLGITETAGQINRKINRKRFTAAFLLACLAAIDGDSAPISDECDAADGE
ncbi:DUF6471 domain-containing protein [Paraburkholderia bryophila]|uniref:DUF6471 domain-containing protein n=1 Tax=Paraburkholderia bryophila TaxID=420952 RepID=A0A329CF98_9BURK|nr:DUF6471 domain-containing protein [Paraburkholderia bryophila]RAS29785.1 hypothetical protein BX591_11060 [Paraburkholderia bryophila]